MEANSTVDAVIFKGGYGIAYAEFAGKQAEKMQPGSTFKVTAATKLAQTLQPRFVAGNPPDVIDNSGEGLIAINTIRDQLEDLTSVIDAPNFEGVPIKDTLYAGVTAPGTFDGKFVQLNYVLTVYAMWYSASLFEAEGWSVPKTWEEMLALGEEAKGKDKFLLGWGKEAATYYQTMAISSAIKQGGDEVRLALENLKPDCWSLQPVQDVFTGMKKIIDAGYIKPGGAGTQFTAAQAQWSNAQDFILYPSGSWIENEMKEQTKKDFQMTGGAGARGLRRLGVAVGGGALDRGRGIHRPHAREERGRRQGVPAGHAVQGGGGQLRQVDLLLDHREGHHSRGRLRLDGPGVPGQGARGGRRERLHLELHRPLRLEHRPAGGVEHLPPGRIERG